MGLKNPSLMITACHHSASLVMPNSDPKDGFLYLTLILMMDSYTLDTEGFHEVSSKSCQSLQKICTRFTGWTDRQINRRLCASPVRKMVKYAKKKNQKVMRT